MRLIGLCGRSGSGKGVFCKAAAEMGIRVVDCDAVYHDIVSRPGDCLFEIGRAFGNEYIVSGSLDRKALAETVFADKGKLARLNSITHKYVLSEADKLLSDAKEDEPVIFDAPALFESGMNEKCDIIIGILASDETCMGRIMKRDGIGSEEAEKRLGSQISLDFIIENSDIVLYNDSGEEKFLASAREVLSQIAEGLI